MGSESLIVRCPQCGTKNRIPGSRWGGKGVCGKCGAALDLTRLYPDKPVNVSDGNFNAEVIDFPGAVLLEFSAPW
jgi:thioredoxin 2